MKRGAVVLIADGCTATASLTTVAQASQLPSWGLKCVHIAARIRGDRRADRAAKKPGRYPSYAPRSEGHHTRYHITALAPMASKSAESRPRPRARPFSRKKTDRYQTCSMWEFRERVLFRPKRAVLGMLHPEWVHMHLGTGK